MNRREFFKVLGIFTAALPVARYIPNDIDRSVFVSVQNGHTITARVWEGHISHVAMWDTVLTNAQMIELKKYDSKIVNIDHNNLVAYYPLSEIA